MINYFRKKKATNSAKIVNAHFPDIKTIDGEEFERIQSEIDKYQNNPEKLKELMDQLLAQKENLEKAKSSLKG
ncbi:MAG TPA: hypothetical protein PKN99_10730 [Cyclobacteriaceae bacterium]|nr:hypothetical protein [Cyclobacteriaceae bacterium]